MESFQGRQQRRRYWGRHIAAWRKSGLTQAEYSRQQQVSSKSISYWSRRPARSRLAAPLLPPTIIAEGSPSPHPLPGVSFVPLPARLVTPTGKPARLGKLVLRVGLRFRVTIPADFCAEGLAQVLRILEGLP